MKSLNYFSKNKKLLRTVVLLIFSFACISFIFWNASRTGEESKALSDKITESVKESVEQNGAVPPPLAGTNAIKVESPSENGNGGVFVNKYYLNIFVRKLGHILEYTALTFFVSLTLVSHGVKKDYTFLLTFFFGFLTALADELIQSQTAGRNGRFADVLIDLCGCIIGIFFSLCIFLAIYYCLFRPKKLGYETN